MFRWADYFGFAREIAQYKGKYPEAFMRSAVSRIYYAIYHNALGHAAAKGYIPSAEDSKGTHRDLIIYYNKNISPWAGSILDQMRIKRVKADYRAEEIINDKTVKASIIQAEKIINFIKSTS